jgi:hypothetical protein
MTSSDERLVILCWLPILALITLLIAQDIWKNRDLLRIPLYFRLTVLLILNQLAAVGILVYAFMSELPSSTLGLHFFVLFWGGWVWSAAIAPIQKWERRRKSKLELDVPVPAKPINPHSAYVIGNDGEIIEVADDEKRKRSQDDEKPKRRRDKQG